MSLYILGLLLLFCGGMHTVWAIYQVLFYQTSEIYRRDLNEINDTNWREHFFKIVMFSERNGLRFTIIMWYIGVMLGCYVAGWYLVRVVQKKNVYVSVLLTFIHFLVLLLLLLLFFSLFLQSPGNWQTPINVSISKSCVFFFASISVHCSTFNVY